MFIKVIEWFIGVIIQNLNIFLYGKGVLKKIVMIGSWKND